MGRCSENLYTQFLYRILYITRKFNLTNVHIGFFSPTGFLCGSSFKLFRKYLFDTFTFKRGVMFNASHFSDVSDGWGISFSVWSIGKATERKSFKYDIIDVDNNEIIITGEKTIYNLDDSVAANDWIRELTNKMKTFDAPQMKSALNIKTEGKTKQGKMTENAIGYFFNDNNNVKENPVGVALFTSCYTKGHGLSITKENMFNCCSLFAARKTICKNWINQNDQYAKPDTNSPLWDTYKNDSLIYSLFHSSSNQSSLRDVLYKEILWDIKNEFFYMSKNEIMKLASEYDCSFTYSDAELSDERYVYEKLKDLKLSDEAKIVLEKAIDLTKKTFRFRKMFDQEHSKYQVLNWDCGWYQIKAIVKEYLNDDFMEFSKLFKQLENKLKPQVYKLGFLR